MSQPILQVLVGFQTTAGFGQPFQLDDAIYGKLDTGTLGGIAFADLTTMVQSVNINRGRSRQLQEFNAGTATVAFWNKSRALDPVNTASPYWNTDSNTTGIVPRLPIQILANGVPIYTGLIQSWKVDYDLANNDMVYAQCADAFTVLSSIDLAAHAVAEEKSGSRIGEVLNYSEVLYQGERNISLGASTLGSSSVNTGFLINEGTNALNYLQSVMQSEQGYLYISANGTLTFKARTEVLNPKPDAIFSGNTSVGIPFQTLNNDNSDELLFNVIVTESPAGGPFTAQDNTSVAQYQAQTYSQTSLLNSTSSEVEQMGQYLLGKYKTPVFRFTGLSTQLSAFDTGKQNDCLEIDLTDIVSVTKHFVTGSPTSITQTAIVSGISHNITPGSHIVSYTLETTLGTGYFTIEDAIFGILDQNLLAF